MRTIEENIKEYYSEKSLSEDKIQFLLNQRTAITKNYFFGKAAVGFVIILVSIFTFFSLRETKLEMRVVNEIAMNHNKQLSVEFAESDLQLLQAKLDKLDFSILPADEFISNNYNLLGGRYCSIQGNLAAQLKLRNINSKKTETLYITDVNKGLKKIRPADTNHDGVQIKIWVKDGLLYGKATDL